MEHEGSLQQSPLDHKLSQTNLFYTLTPTSFRIHFSNVPIYMSRSRNWSLLFRSTDQNFVRISHFLRTMVHTYDLIFLEWAP
jgi:hypothetical protein